MNERFADGPGRFPWVLTFVEETDLDREKAPETVRVGGRTEYGRVLLSDPQVTDLLTVAPDAAHRAIDYLEARLAISFVPARGRSLAWARLVAEMVTPAGVAPAPLTRDLFPRSVRAAVRYARSFTVSPSLSFGFTEVADGAEAPLLAYEPTVDGAGLLTDTAMWTFEGTGRAGLRGVYELFLIAEVPAGARVQLRTTVDVEGRGRYGPVPLRRAGTGTSPVVTRDLRLG